MPARGDHKGRPYDFSFFKSILVKIREIMWKAARRSEMQTSDPKPGDVFIQIKSGGKGHTGFVVGVSPNGKAIYTGEGNCGNRLKIGKRKRESINHFVDCLQDGQEIDFSRSNFDIKAVDDPGKKTPAGVGYYPILHIRHKFVNNLSWI